MTPIQKAIQAAGGPRAVAERLGVSQQAVYFWRSGDRKFPHELGAALEGLAGASVTRRELFPADWWLVWPELVTEAHPIPVREAA